MDDLLKLNLKKIIYIIGNQIINDELKNSLEKYIKYRDSTYKIITNNSININFDKNKFFDNYFFEDKSINPFRKFGIFNKNWIEKYQNEIPSFIIFAVDLKDNNINSFIENHKLIYDNENNSITKYLNKNKIKFIFIIYNNTEKLEYIKNQIKENLKVKNNYIFDSILDTLCESIFNLIFKKSPEFYKKKIDKIKTKNGKIILDSFQILKEYLIKNYIKQYYLFIILNNKNKAKELIEKILNKIKILIDEIKDLVFNNKKNKKYNLINNLYNIQKIYELQYLRNNFFIFDIFNKFNNKSFNLNEFIFNVVKYIVNSDKLWESNSLKFLNYKIQIQFLYIFLYYSINFQFKIIFNNNFLKKNISNFFILLIKLSITRYLNYTKNEKKYQFDKNYLKSEFYGICLRDTNFKDENEFFKNNDDIFVDLIIEESNTFDYEEIVKLVNNYLNSNLNIKINNEKIIINKINLLNNYLKKSMISLDINNFDYWNNIKLKLIKNNINNMILNENDLLIYKFNLLFYKKRTKENIEIIKEFDELFNSIKIKTDLVLNLYNKEYSSKIYTLFEKFNYNLDENIIIKSKIKINKILKKLCDFMNLEFNSGEIIELKLSEFEEDNNIINFEKKIDKHGELKNIYFTKNNDLINFKIFTLFNFKENSIIKCNKNIDQNFLNFEIEINEEIYHNEITPFKISIKKLVNENIKINLLNLNLEKNNKYYTKISSFFKSINWLNNDLNIYNKQLNIESTNDEEINLEKFFKIELFSEFNCEIVFVLNYEVIFLKENRKIILKKEYSKKIIFLFPILINQMINDTSNILYQNSNNQTLYLVNKNLLYNINLKLKNDFILEDINLIKNEKLIYNNIKENDQIDIKKLESLNYNFIFKSNKVLNDESIGRLVIKFKRKGSDKTNYFKINLKTISIVNYPVDINLFFEENIEYGNKTKFIINLLNRNNEKWEFNYNLFYSINEYYLGGLINSIIKMDENQNMNLNYYLVPLKYGLFNYPQIKISLLNSNEIYNIILFNNILIKK